MTRIDHFGVAERLLQEAAEAGPDVAGVLAARAHGHALLALASATAPNIYPTAEMTRRREAAEDGRRAKAEAARTRRETGEKQPYARSQELQPGQLARELREKAERAVDEQPNRWAPPAPS